MSVTRSALFCFALGLQSDVLGITVGTPMSGGGGVLSSLSTANKNAAVSHGSTPYVYPEDFGGIPTMTRSRTEQAAVESAEKRHASPMPIRGGGSGGGVASSWNSARLGRLEDTGVGSYQSNNSMGLYAVGSAGKCVPPVVIPSHHLCARCRQLCLQLGCVHTLEVSVRAVVVVVPPLCLQRRPPCHSCQRVK